MSISIIHKKLKDGYQKTTVLINQKSDFKFILLSNKDGFLDNYLNIFAISIIEKNHNIFYKISLKDSFLYDLTFPSIVSYIKGKKDYEQYNQKKTNCKYLLKDFLTVLMDLVKNKEEINLRNFIDNYFLAPSREGDLPSLLYYQENKVVCEIWFENGVMSRSGDLPAYIRYWGLLNESDFYSISEKIYYKNNMRQRDSQNPSFISYFKDGKESAKKWFKEDELDNKIGPAFILYYPSGKVYKEEYYKKSLIHRDNGAAILTYTEEGEITKEIWALEGKRIFT